MEKQIGERELAALEAQRRRGLIEGEPAKIAIVEKIPGTGEVGPVIEFIGDVGRIPIPAPRGG